MPAGYSGFLSPDDCLMKEPFRFVIVGTGVISKAYISALESLSGVELAGIVSRTEKRPASLSSAPNVPVVSDLALMQSPFDAVILATPNGLHHKDAIVAAQMGAHVLSEKVLDISLDACDRMIATCEEHNVRLGVAYQRRTSPVNRQLKKLIDQGAFGRIFAADLEAKFYRGQEYYGSSPYRGTKAIDGGGPFFQQASHDLDLLVWFFGMPVRIASALGTFQHDIESEDHGAAIMKFESGMIGTLIASTCCKPQQAAKLTIHSDRGTMVVSGDRIVSMEMDGLAPDLIDAIEVESLLPGHEGIIQDFVEAVRNNRTPLVSGTEARKSVELILRIYNAEI